MTEPTAPLAFSHVPVAATLLSLADAKQHLHITDTTHDADVTQKTKEAQDAIVAVLSYAADPAWTAATVPTPILSAIKLLLSALYELRGGEDRTDDWRRTWAAIDALLATYRDPTLR